MDLVTLKNHCQDLAFEGKDYQEIEQEISFLQISEKDRDLALKSIDKYIVHYEISQQEKQKHLYKLMIGLLLVFIGGGALMTSVGNAPLRLVLYSTVVGWFAEDTQLIGSP